MTSGRIIVAAHRRVPIAPRYGVTRISSISASVYGALPLDRDFAPVASGVVLVSLSFEFGSHCPHVAVLAEIQRSRVAIPRDVASEIEDRRSFISCSSSGNRIVGLSLPAPRRASLSSPPAGRRHMATTFPRNTSLNTHGSA